MNKDYIFFDLDGVVLDSMPYHAKAWIEAFSQFGLEFTEEEIYLHEGAIELETAKSLFLKKGINPTPEFFEKAFKLQKIIFKKKYASLIKPFPEIPEILEKLNEYNKKLALVTSSHKEIFEEVFPRNLKPFFSIIITGDLVKRRKPYPDPYLKALELLRAQKEKSLVIENAPAGILSAKQAGLHCIAIATTLPKERLVLADLIAKNHEELKKILLNEKQ